MPKGTATYVRHITTKRHGTPKQFAKKCADHGLSWIALGALWQDVKDGRPTNRMINKAETIERYGDALAAKGLDVSVWGYPWIGREEQFVERMSSVALWGRVLLDPEKGANPTHSAKGAGKKAANDHAAKLVELFGDVDLDELGLSTFGSGWRMGWFPLLAFTKALIKHFGGRCFIGGQTYTDDAVIDRSIGDMAKCIVKAGGVVIIPEAEHNPPPNEGVEIVPNCGNYTWELNGKRGKRRKGAKVKAKTAAEFRAHLHEFIDDDEPIDAVICWAENFMTNATRDEYARFADLMARGACRLPKS